MQAVTRVSAWVLLFAGTVAVAVPSSPAIRRCVAAGGDVSYQSVPCPAGVRQDWVRPIVPPAPARTRAGAPPATVSRDRGVARVPARLAASARRATPDAAAKRRCETARRRAAETRDRQWNRLGFRELSSLDAGVARACAR